MRANARASGGIRFLNARGRRCSVLLSIDDALIGAHQQSQENRAKREAHMHKGRRNSNRIDRRGLLKLAGGAGVAAGLGLPGPATAQETTLSIWTGYPELVPYY